MAEKADPKQKPAKSGKPWLIIAIVAVVAAGAAGGAAWFFTSRGDHADPKDAKAEAKKHPVVPAPAQYYALEPAFVVNLAGSTSGASYLQVEVQLMTRNPEAMKLIELHAPALRAKLLMLFGQQNAQDLMSREGKEKLQAQALGEVRKVMTTETGEASVDALLFTSFVMQ